MKIYRKRRTLYILLVLSAILFLVMGIYYRFVIKGVNFGPAKEMEKPDSLLMKYMSLIEQEKYEEMYDMTVMAKQKDTSDKDVEMQRFIERNQKIYQGISAKNIEISDVLTEENEDGVTVVYLLKMDTVAGEISFQNEADFEKIDGHYYLLWDDHMIFPELDSSTNVSVKWSSAKRGEIYDRKGRMLAGKGTASSVGIVPGKLENRKKSLKKIADLLEMKSDDIDKKLSAKWVKDDSFVPVATLPKIMESDLLKYEPEKGVLQEKERQDHLLEIAGVMIADTEIRTYPMKEAAAHLIGYVQGVTAEDLEKHDGEGYRSTSVIGRTGMEGLFEKELKGEDGCSICIVDEDGKVQSELATKFREDGENIQLTIDKDLQGLLYEEFRDDRGCSVALDPKTGEVLALVSTPSYDNNLFISGLSGEKWDQLNHDDDNPLYNRFRGVWCPGSTFKPVIASIGLDRGCLDPKKDYGSEGLSWQKDESWGGYQVTTLHTYSPVNVKNALVYSDNIFFAKAALKIGAGNLEQSLQEIGFGEEIPFEISMTKSSYSGTDKIETEIGLADTGYGQGQVLINPLHLVCIYTAFLNHGNMLKPFLLFDEGREPEIWIEQAFLEDSVKEVMEGLEGVVNEEGGTGYYAHRLNRDLAGKTGTAELKGSKEDKNGTEIGWFSIFTTGEEEKPVLILSMVEDVKGEGGSGYVVRKDTEVLRKYFMLMDS